MRPRGVGLTAVIALLALTISVLAAPLAAGAQVGTVPRIGVLLVWSSTDPLNGLLRQALGEAGYAEGRSIIIEYRWAEGKTERLPALAAELVHLKVNAIMTFGDPAVRAVQRATTAIPIVAGTDDLVAAGLVESFARPGRNTTGVSILATELNVKRLELLKAALPGVPRVAALWDPGTGTLQLKTLKAAAQSLGVELQILEVRSPGDLSRAFESAKNGRAGALNVLASPFLNAYRKTIIDLAAKNQLPAIYQWKDSAEAGGLMSYGPTIVELFQRATTILDKILKGAKPADLPVEQPTKLELVINLKTAKALGLTIPQSVLQRADEVIQ